MNWLSRVFFGPGGGIALSASSSSLVGATPQPTGILSPFADLSHLAHIAYSEIFSGGGDIVDRAAAMRVAPMKRGRAIIVGSVADLPLEAGAFDGDEFVLANRQPSWLTRSATASTVWHRMAMTLDDLIFRGWSLWALQRSEAGTILDAVRVAPERWTFDSATPLGIRVNDEEVTDPKSVILFAGPDEGVLATGADIIRGARAMEKAWVGRVQNPIPAMVLHETERNGVTADEAQTYVDTWSSARTSPNGAVGFLPAQLNMEVYGDTNADLFTEGRNNVRLDVANLLNLPASVLDGSTATASLTYVTQEGQRSALIDWLEYWLAPIEARLSQSDVTPQGQVVRFNRTNLTRVPNQSHGPDLPDETPETPAVEAAA